MTSQHLQRLVSQCNAIARRYYPTSYCTVHQMGYYLSNYVGGQYWGTEFTVRVWDEGSEERFASVGGIESSDELLTKLEQELDATGPAPITPPPPPPARAWIGSGRITTQPGPHPFPAFPGHTTS